MYSEYEYDEVYSEDGGHEYDEDGSLVSDTCAGKKLFFKKGWTKLQSSTYHFVQNIKLKLIFCSYVYD